MARGPELRQLNDDELAQRLVEAKQELFQLRFQVATGKQDNSARIGLVRREVASVLTLQHERAAGTASETSAAAPRTADQRKVKR